MTNERAIEILEDLYGWLYDAEPLHYSAAEIAKAIQYFKSETELDETVQVLNDYRNWLEFGQPFYHSLDKFVGYLSMAIIELSFNQ